MSSRPEILTDILASHPDKLGLQLLVLQLAASLYIPRLREVFMPALKAMPQRHPEKVLMLSVHGPADAVAELTATACGGRRRRSLDGDAAGLCALAEARRTPPHAPIPLPAAAPLDPAALRTEAAAKHALAAAGLPVLPERVVHSATEAAEAATARLASRWC